MSDNQGLIYELTFEDSEKYIGITKVSLKSRLYSHKKTFKEKIIEAVIIDIVNLEDLYYFEKFYISLYKSFGLKLKNSNNGGGGKLPFYLSGEKYSTPVESLQRNPNIKRRAVIKYDNFLNVEGSYESIKIAEYENSLHNGLIGKIITGKRCRDNNTIWSYNENELIIQEIKENYTTRKVCPFCLSDNTIKNGKYLVNYTRYKCKDCNKGYNDTTYFPFLLNKLLFKN